MYSIVLFCLKRDNDKGAIYWLDFELTNNTPATGSTLKALFKKKWPTERKCINSIIYSLVTPYGVKYVWQHCYMLWLACRLFGAKPLPGPVLSYCQLNQTKLGMNLRKTNLKMQNFSFKKKRIWICRLQNGGHFVSTALC